MEITSKLLERINSPSSNESNSFSNYSSSTTTTVNGGGGRGGGGGGRGGGIRTHIPIARSDQNNPYPTTFVTADTSSFKQVVQMLTGSSETSKNLSKQQPHDLLPAPSKNFVIPPNKTSPKKQGFKLYERRNILRNNLMISPLKENIAAQSSCFSPRKLEILSPSLLDFPSLTLSPATPLVEDDPSDKSSPSVGNSSSSEERAIAEKGFYLHPSPISTPRESEPLLLPLFPVTSPRVSETRNMGKLH